jgi:hypothetical protein
MAYVCSIVLWVPWRSNIATSFVSDGYYVFVMYDVCVTYILNYIVPIPERI